MTTHPLIDEMVLKELRETLGEDFIPELVSTYLEETPRLVDALQSELAAGNGIAFTRLAHSIKTSSASLGALSFAERARELEMIGKSGDLSQAVEKMGELVHAYPELETALQELIGEGP